MSRRPEVLELKGYVHVYSGKVRELYAPVDPSTGLARQDRLLLVASDRISAYDHILDSQIPDKGKVLTQLSLWWFRPADRHHPQPRDLQPGARRAGGRGRACRLGAAARHGADRVHRAGLPDRQRT